MITLEALREFSIPPGLTAEPAAGFDHILFSSSTTFTALSCAKEIATLASYVMEN